MWVIFLIGALVFVLITMVVVWIGNKLYISMKKDNKKFEKEFKEETKNEG